MGEKENFLHTLLLPVTLPPGTLTQLEPSELLDDLLNFPQRARPSKMKSY
jgi:hypothetical protein